MPQTRWGQVSQSLKSTVGQNNFKTWIEPLKLNSLEDGVAHFEVPTNFFGNWVSRNFSDTIVKQMSRDGLEVRRLEFRVPSSKAPAAAAAQETQPADVQAAPAGGARAAAASPGRRGAYGTAGENGTADDDLPGANLDERFNFDSFVVGKPNQLAYTAARRVSEGGPLTFNPLFLYGGSGLGKTHLMHAIAWALKENCPEKKVVYLSSDQFMYRFVRALREDGMHEFKQAFRSVDVLMVDDIQFFAGKNSTQEEFFHTFNALADQNKQIVISADRPPHDIKKIEDRIASRLASGLVVDLHPTDYELRLGILQQKADFYRSHYGNLEISKHVLEFLAHRITGNVRTLEGALTRIFAFGNLVGREVTLDMVQECLADLLRASERKLTIEEIQRRVCEHFNVRISDMTGPKRHRTIARPRQVAMFLAKGMTSRSLPEIGRRFGNRDHTTVLYAIRKIEELVQTDSGLADDIEMLKRMLEA
ncbi:chromosomal replication initiator protein DnaA [Oceanicola sp. 502str15]|uniref:chromosomal replication initiator protein DnaA n=1 Tax=Oceanicola sp. 502str15 TaxID=2696061 RepID=UPI0020955D2C|nr:chromosomal replication initiator protein DnaA [Oceanicola sp. 502str15]MCO6383705.1 chromosomal replication initiator protein DnaA [Oceanicola sp. 502str15]